MRGLKKQIVIAIMIILICAVSGCDKLETAFSEETTTVATTQAYDYAEEFTSISDSVEETAVQLEKEFCSAIVPVSDKIDETFAAWLYSNYKVACDAIKDSIQSHTYEDQLWYQETGKSIFVLKDEYNGYLVSEDVMKEHNIYQKTCASSDYVNLSFAGDISFANDYLPGQNYNNYGINGAYSPGVQACMKNADIFMLNNEFCYTNRGVAQTAKGYCFRADPSTVSCLDEMGVDIVSVANNHAYDYGEQGFIDTIDTLKANNTPYVGGGMNLEDAKNNIVYFIANGIKIGYIAATQIERDVLFTQPATENSAGVTRCYDPTMVNEMIAIAKSNCDFVIVYPHWGTELVKEIQSDQQALAYSFIEAGADAIVGGHPHCLQGIEYYQDVPIFYSLSNFSFSSKIRESAILNLQVTIDGIQQARYIPCMESTGITIQCDKGDGNYENIISILNTYSANASVDNEGIVTKTE